MSNPLALLYYTNLLPGSQLASRLQDLGYRVQTVTSAAALASACEGEMPMVLIAELAPDVCAAVSKLKANPATQHIPVLGYARLPAPAAQTQARESGVTLVAADAGIPEQLPQLLEQIPQIE